MIKIIVERALEILEIIKIIFFGELLKRLKKVALSLIKTIK